MVTRVPTRRATFIPFEAMTAREQAEHLVQAHGMNGDYWGDDLAAGKSDEEIVAWLLSWGRQWVNERHETDHDYVDENPEVLACRHTHAKPVQRPEFRCPKGDWMGDDGYCPRHRCRSGNRYEDEGA